MTPILAQEPVEYVTKADLITAVDQAIQNKLSDISLDWLGTSLIVASLILVTGGLCCTWLLVKRRGA